jgi:hypothetical protein
MISSIVVGALGYLGMFSLYGFCVIVYIISVNAPKTWESFIEYLKGTAVKEPVMLK